MDKEITILVFIIGFLCGLLIFPAILSISTFAQNYCEDQSMDSYIENSIGWGSGIGGNEYVNPYNESTDHHRWELFKRGYEAGIKEYNSLHGAKP